MVGLERFVRQHAAYYRRRGGRKASHAAGKRAGLLTLLSNVLRYIGSEYPQYFLHNCIHPRLINRDIPIKLRLHKLYKEALHYSPLN